MEDFGSLEVREAKKPRKTKEKTLVQVSLASPRDNGFSDRFVIGVDPFQSNEKFTAYTIFDKAKGYNITTIWSKKDYNTFVEWYLKVDKFAKQYAKSKTFIKANGQIKSREEIKQQAVA